MTAQTLTLADFLLVRIAEDEEVARSARPDERLRTRDQSGLVGGADREGYAFVCATSGRVLAECAAKRTIVAAHPLITDPKRLVPVWAGSTPGAACETCGGSPVASDSLIEDIGPCDTLRALASVYADHPLYRAEWEL